MMLTGAMADIPIIPEEEEEKMNPQQLSDALLYRYRIAKRMKVDVMRQYTVDYQELIHDVEEGKVTFPISAMEYDARASSLTLRRATGILNRPLTREDINKLEAVDEEGLSAVNEDNDSSRSFNNPAF